MCIGVSPNGLHPQLDAFLSSFLGITGKRTHVSVRFYKMQDANTETLKWPARLSVNIQIMNHTTGQWEREYTDDHTRDKPTSDYCESSTNYQYLPHSELAPYLNDDCLHIRVSSKFTVG